MASSNSSFCADNDYSIIKKITKSSTQKELFNEVMANYGLYLKKTQVCVITSKSRGVVQKSHIILFMYNTGLFAFFRCTNKRIQRKSKILFFSKYLVWHKMIIVCPLLYSLISIFRNCNVQCFSFCVF